jgi:hypothetical protein
MKVSRVFCFIVYHDVGSLKKGVDVKALVLYNQCLVGVKNDDERNPTNSKVFQKVVDNNADMM